MVPVLGTLAPSAGDVMVVSGFGPIAPPGANAYRKPSLLVVYTWPFAITGEP